MLKIEIKKLKKQIYKELYNELYCIVYVLISSAFYLYYEYFTASMHYYVVVGILMLSLNGLLTPSYRYSELPIHV